MSVAQLLLLHVTLSVLLSLAAFSESDFSLQSFLCISCFSSGVSEQMVPTLTPSSLAPSGNYFMSMYLNIIIGLCVPCL